MRNNDLDFIKDKFKKAQPDVPSSLDEDLLKYQILSKKEHKTIKFEQKKKINFKPILTAAACFILVFGVLLAVNPFAKNEMKAENFKDYDEINTVVAGLEKWGAGEGMGSGGPTLFQDIYTPDDLNNRGKRIVTNGKYIFYSYYDSWNMENRNKFYIFSAESENARLINIMNDITPSDDYEIDSLFLVDNRLISITNRVDLEKREALSGQEVVLYDVTDMSNPLVLDRLVLEDAQSCTDIRQDENDVFTFSTYFADGERRTDGVESFEITEDKIVSKGEFANQSNLMYYGSDIIVGDYVYSFDKNNEAEEKDKVTIHPYKYK